VAERALELADVSAGYGDTVVLENVNLALKPGETLSVVGRNGVGKTTLLGTIMGHTTLHRGTIRLHGEDISRRTTYRRVTAGLGYVPQEREIFPSLSVRENLEVAARAGPWTVETVFELFPKIAERAANRGNQLSGGEQQMLAIGRALIGNPTVLLMDEPSEGLAPVIVEELARVVKKLATDSGLTLILVEQNTRLALDISPRTVVMDRGRIVHDGPSVALKKDPAKLEQLIGVARA
jgi:branched-chain amino acid transport system ATP-binding protein